MSVLSYKCKGCGGELTFDPQSQKFECAYCGSSYAREELEGELPKKADDAAESAADSTAFDAVLYNCPSCGAEIVTDSTTAATYCFYCHNPVVISGRLGGEFAPSRVIPFKYDRETAVAKFVAWTKTKFFLPKDFFSEKAVEKLTGVYFPYWVIDCDADASLVMNAKNVRIWRTGNRRYTETSTYKAIREGEVHLEDIIKTALKKADKQLIESVQPFDSSNMEKFSMTYLSGFQAEKRDVEAAEIEQETKSDIDRYCINLLSDTVTGYSTKLTEQSSTDIKKLDYEYCLLPVWVMTYKYNGKDYYYAMNGQSGKICGKLPVDKLKLFLCSAGLTAAVGLIGAIGGYLI
ncbi:MAG: TFIIB-type zinc ribbon-containing protein [Oscillospiraceae bacterium]|jgi:uncharacterized ParB-like nuclease family protein